MNVINRREWFKRTSKILPFLFLSFFSAAYAHSKPSMNTSCISYAKDKDTITFKR